MLDHLRGMYIRSPHWIRSSVAPILAAFPVGLRYGATYRQLRGDIKRSESDSSFVEKYRLDQIRSIARSCINYNLYYRNLFERVYGELPDVDKYTYEQYQKLPILTKEEVLKAPEKFLVQSLNRVDLATTSGSSGVPLKFYLDKNRSVKEWAFVHHMWERIGYSPRNRRVVLRGVKFADVDNKPWEYDPALAELRLSPFHLTPKVMNKYLELIDLYKIRYIWGYPSAISTLANHVLRTNWKFERDIIGVFPISESLFPHQRELMLKAFCKAKVLMTYGLSEKSVIGSELPDEPDVYEFEPLYGIAELVDANGKTITLPGQIGKIVATGFISKSMPMLRYDTNDLAELVRPATKQNCYRMRVRSIRSRWGQEFVVGKNGELISIAAINIHSPVYSRIQAFQLFQEEPGKVNIRIIPVSGNSKQDILPFVREIQDKVGQSIMFSLELTQSLPLNDRGKRKYIEQRLNLDDYKV